MTMQLLQLNNSQAKLAKEEEKKSVSIDKIKRLKQIIFLTKFTDYLKQFNIFTPYFSKKNMNKNIIMLKTMIDPLDNSISGRLPSRSIRKIEITVDT